jgi:large subunit ribosomal protein L31
MSEAIKNMKDDIHPDYQEVLFVDSSTGTKYLIGSTLKADQTEKFEGKEYPVHRVSISSSSHPFFTGSKQILDTEGRVDKFTKRYQMKREQGKKEQEKQEEAAKKKIVKKTRSKKK